MKNKKAFTLAEILITLVIVGIIVALTIVPITHYYTKNLIETRLKKSYLTLSHALERARVDYGDPSGWDNITLPSANSNEAVEEQVEKLILPYLSNVGYAGTSTLGARGFDIAKRIDGNVQPTNMNSKTITYYIIEMSDGIKYFFTRDSTSSLFIYTYIYGGYKNNIWGRNAFLMRVNPSTGTLEAWSATYGKTDSTYCNTSSQSLGCMYVIMANNWKIPDNYPIKY